VTTGASRGLEIIPDVLSRAGVGSVFAMLGGTNVPWVAQGVKQDKFRFVRTRHEETAVGGAVGYSRTTGGVGVCTVTRGPGFANSINALITAVHNHVPIVLFVGESPPTARWTPQVLDQRGICEIIGAGFRHVSSTDELEDACWQSVADACSRGVPQVVSIGDGVMSGVAMMSNQTAPPPRPASEIDQDNLNTVVDLLATCERPLVLAGRGAMLAGCRADLEELANVVGANVASTLAANRFFSGHPRDLGVCGNLSMRGPREVIGTSDVVLSVGASLNDYTTAKMKAFGDAKVVQVEIDDEAEVKSSSHELALLGDAREVAQALLEAWKTRGLPSRQSHDRIPTRADVRRTILGVDLGHDPKRGLDSRQVYAWLDDHLPPDRIVVTDGGRAVGGPTASLVDARDASSWVTGTSFQSIGQGLGLAIGAAVAHPERSVVLLCGDGGFMMATSGLDTVRLEGLSNLTIVVMNDQMYATELKYLREFSLPHDIVEQEMADIPLLAAAYGGIGKVVRTMEELDRLDLDGPTFRIFDIRIDQIDTLNL